MPLILDDLSYQFLKPFFTTDIYIRTFHEMENNIYVNTKYYTFTFSVLIQELKNELIFR